MVQLASPTVCSSAPQQLPFQSTHFQYRVGSQLAVVLYPFCLAILLPACTSSLSGALLTRRQDVYRLVLEKQSHLREMMAMVSGRALLGCRL
jgi:hypothetical protein